MCVCVNSVCVRISRADTQYLNLSTQAPPRTCPNFKTVRSEFNTLALPLSPVRKGNFRKDQSSSLCLTGTRPSIADFRPFVAHRERVGRSHKGREGSGRSILGGGGRGSKVLEGGSCAAASNGSSAGLFLVTSDDLIFNRIKYIH